MTTPDVQPAETLYRQVGPGGNPIYYDPDHEPPLHDSLFIPNNADTDGLSLTRSRFRAQVWAAFRVEQPDTRFRLARTQASFLVEIAESVGLPSLNFDPSPDNLDHRFGEPWAHCVGREINRTD